MFTIITSGIFGLSPDLKLAGAMLLENFESFFTNIYDYLKRFAKWLSAKILGMSETPPIIKDNSLEEFAREQGIDSEELKNSNKIWKRKSIEELAKDLGIDLSKFKNGSYEDVQDKTYWDYVKDPKVYGTVIGVAVLASIYLYSPETFTSIFAGIASIFSGFNGGNHPGNGGSPSSFNSDDVDHYMPKKSDIDKIEELKAFEAGTWDGERRIGLNGAKEMFIQSRGQWMTEDEFMKTANNFNNRLKQSVTDTINKPTLKIDTSEFEQGSSKGYFSTFLGKIIPGDLWDIYM